jgi:hypothetical protein
LRRIGGRTGLGLRQRLDLALFNLLGLRPGGREEFVGQKAPADQHERAQHDGQEHIAIIVHKIVLEISSWLSGDRVETLSAPGMATEDSFEGEPAALQRPIAP